MVVAGRNTNFLVRESSLELTEAGAWNVRKCQ